MNKIVANNVQIIASPAGEIIAVTS